MQNVALPSGSVIGLQIAQYKKSARLKNAVLAELVGVNLPIPNGMDVKAFFVQDTNKIKDVVLKLVISAAVDAAIWECASSCTYLPAGSNPDAVGTNIAVESFEPEQARQDFLPVAWEVIKLNVLPFFGSLSALWSSLDTGKSASSPP